MPATIVLALAFTGSLPAAFVERQSPRSAEELRSAYRDALQQTAPRERPDYATVIPQAVQLYAELAAAEEQYNWDARVFTERQQSLPLACEVPVLIEQRLFELGRAIRAHMSD